MDFYFDAPGEKPFPGVVCIGVTDSSSPVAAASRGWLKGISPEEPRHALVLAIARDLRSGLPIAAWKTLALSIVMEFRTMATEDDFFWEATKLRESVGVQFVSMYYGAASCQGHGGAQSLPWLVAARCFGFPAKSIRQTPQQGPARLPNRRLQGSPGGGDGEAPVGRRSCQAVEFAGEGELGHPAHGCLHAGRRACLGLAPQTGLLPGAHRRGVPRRGNAVLSCVVLVVSPVAEQLTQTSHVLRPVP